MHLPASPKDLRFRWVPEWQRHQATWIAWPHQLLTWGDQLRKVRDVFERMVRTLAEVEQVHVLGGPPDSLRDALQRLSTCRNVMVHPITTDDNWIRDYGPTFILNNDAELAAVDWQFNSWGRKYEPYDNDAASAERICNLVGCRRFDSALTIEGGAIETDGEGTLLTTSSCALSPARNPGWSKEKVEANLRDYLSIDKVMWIDGGSLAGDDTDSHIDQLVRFVRPGLIVAATSRHENDLNRVPLEQQWDSLQHIVDAQGRKIETLSLETPPPRYWQGQRVPESYCNFYIANEIILLPTFEAKRYDEAAQATVQNCFPDHTILPIPCCELVTGLGAIHCATQQQPFSAEVSR